MNKVFLTACWQQLLMINYEVDPKVLQPLLPPYTELDFFSSKCLVSLVGFNFLQTRMLNIHWPWHVNFPEVNLRFYVKRREGQQWKRGVAFVSEIVPRPAIAYTARLLYHEPYRAMRMRQQVVTTPTIIRAAFEWKFRGLWNQLQVEAANEPRSMQQGTEEQFIFEHYWGYNRYNATTTIEYCVEHPTWRTYPVKSWRAHVNVEALYGKAFAPFLSQQPSSVFLAEGSPVLIRKPSRLIRP